MFYWWPLLPLAMVLVVVVLPQVWVLCGGFGGFGVVDVVLVVGGGVVSGVAAGSGVSGCGGGVVVDVVGGGVATGVGVVWWMWCWWVWWMWWLEGGVGGGVATGVGVGVASNR